MQRSVEKSTQQLQTIRPMMGLHGASQASRVRQAFRRTIWELTCLLFLGRPGVEVHSKCYWLVYIWTKPRASGSLDFHPDIQTTNFSKMSLIVVAGQTSRVNRNFSNSLRARVTVPNFCLLRGLKWVLCGHCAAMRPRLLVAPLFSQHPTTSKVEGAPVAVPLQHLHR